MRSADLRAKRDDLVVRVVDPLSRRLLANRQFANLYWHYRRKRKGTIRANLERAALENPRAAQFYWQYRKETVKAKKTTTVRKP